jgi:Gram-negative bacterial TonB protein C-terminal
MKKSILWISFAMNICKVTAQIPIDSSKLKTAEPTTIFCIAPQFPSFPGGYEAIVKYLKDTIRYPDIARKHNIQGTVYLGFTVQKDGQITDIVIKRGVSYPDIIVRDTTMKNVCYVQFIKNPAIGSLEAEAKKVVANMPKWINKSNQAIKYTLPIKFKLD